MSMDWNQLSFGGLPPTRGSRVWGLSDREVSDNLEATYPVLRRDEKTATIDSDEEALSFRPFGDCEVSEGGESILHERRNKGEFPCGDRNIRYGRGVYSAKFEKAARLSVAGGKTVVVEVGEGITGMSVDVCSGEVPRDYRISFHW